MLNLKKLLNKTQIMSIFLHCLLFFLVLRIKIGLVFKYKCKHSTKKILQYKYCLCVQFLSVKN